MCWFSALPQMVGLGLVSVYELIRGSVSAYPALCIRALEALLDILQGQQPDALRSEPQEVIGESFKFRRRKGQRCRTKTHMKYSKVC